MSSISEKERIRRRKKINNNIEDISEIWNNFYPPINIIYPIWEKDRWLKEIGKSIYLNENIGNDVFSKLGEDNEKNLAKWLVNIGPMVTTGDMYAMQYIMMTMINIYGPDSIKLYSAWDLINDNNKSESILKKNIVLIGGPSGNPITYKLLEKWNACSIFPDAPQSDSRIRKLGYNQDNIDSYIWNKKDNGIYDCGLVLSGKNPWNVEEKKFIALMGSGSWGTHACASVICSLKGTRGLKKFTTLKDPSINDTSWINYFSYIHVYPAIDVGNSNEELPELVYPTGNVEIVYPKYKEKISNPISIIQSNKELMNRKKGVNLELGFRPLVLMFSFINLSIASGVLFFSIFSKHIFEGITIFTGLLIIGLFSFLKGLKYSKRNIIDKSISNGKRNE